MNLTKGAGGARFARAIIGRPSQVIPVSARRSPLTQVLMLHHSQRLAIAILSTVLMGTSYAQEPVAWRDPSKHQVRLVTVEKDVDLEVLDWGGSGRPVVLLAVNRRRAMTSSDGRMTSFTSWTH